MREIGRKAHATRTAVEIELEHLDELGLVEAYENDARRIVEAEITTKGALWCEQHGVGAIFRGWNWNISRPAVHFTLRRLAQKGLVREEPDGARRGLFPT